MPNEDELLSDNELQSLKLRLEDIFVGKIQKLELFGGASPTAALKIVTDRLAALIESADEPQFDQDGFLPPLHLCTELEVNQWFGGNPTRRQLLERIHTWIRLGREVGARRLLLDGSFVTAKDAPGDVDAAILLPSDFPEQVEARNPAALELLIAGMTRDPKEIFLAEFERDWWGRVEFFGRTRLPNGRRKGLIEVQL